MVPCLAREGPEQDCAQQVRLLVWGSHPRSPCEIVDAGSASTSKTAPNKLIKPGQLRRASPSLMLLTACLAASAEDNHWSNAILQDNSVGDRLGGVDARAVWNMADFSGSLPPSPRSPLRREGEDKIPAANPAYPGYRTKDLTPHTAEFTLRMGLHP